MADEHICTHEELAALCFDGVTEFRPDGYGAGTPEFRKQLEQYMHESLVGTRLAIAFLGFSKQECVEKIGDMESTRENSSIGLVDWFKDTHDRLAHLASIVRADDSTS